MKLRSSIFLTLSLIVHALCISALALSHFKNIESTTGNDTEITVGEVPVEAEAQAQAQAQPEPKAVEAPVKKKVSAAKVKPTPPAPAKKEEPKIATTLPPKEKVADDVPVENMSPEIDDDQAVAVAEPNLELIPVKEKIAAVEPMEDGDTEATSAPGLGQGGGTKADAVDYTELKQFSGNQPPIYPLLARKEKRQGQVDLLYRVTKEGRVAEIQVAKSSGHADLDEAAVKAIAKYKFVPGQEGWARHPVIFAIKGEISELPSKLRSNSAAME